MEEIYKENIIDHYKNPRNKREMTSADVVSKEHNPLCGDEVTMYFKVDNGTITEVSFTGEGCAISQAAVSLLTDLIKGKKIEEIKKLPAETVLELLGIQISHTRIRCALLGLKTIHNGFRDR
ncbi:SUF system NifU family Fe-S cluster assembly protein [Candidatus Woesearchaeota archaeon CG10_big_fil_rev_8_21_14_0_10_45_16]|nr:MAG: SUF system NifU family Fe-S cluster assembly protein [Candidatus Woesearchaeota archaeon CG10_big_fil_rev_8_21_14_0_10_45_16]